MMSSTKMGTYSQNVTSCILRALLYEHGWMSKANTHQLILNSLQC
jgi:hypothetical protein